MSDLSVGSKFGQLTIISKPYYRDKYKYVDCLCDCGNPEVRCLRPICLTREKRPTVSCGCLSIVKGNARREVPEEGDTYGRLTIIKDLGTISYNEKFPPVTYVQVACSCGSPAFEVKFHTIKTGHTTSCGCYAARVRIETSTKHSMSDTKIYRVYQAMKGRCNNPKDTAFYNYGGRGIEVCQEWSTFEGFYKDMESGYSDGLEIDRINVNGNYCKENCQWTTHSVNNHNKRKSENRSSIYYGVYYNKINDTWIASLTKDCKKVFTKTFYSEYDAAVAYDNASEATYGDRPNKTVQGVIP